MDARFHSLQKKRPPPDQRRRSSMEGESALTVQPGVQSTSDATRDESWNTSSTRRFCCRPPASSLLATGVLSPLPTVLICVAATPRSNSAACTEAARLSDKLWLYWSLPTLSV